MEGAREERDETQGAASGENEQSAPAMLDAPASAGAPPPEGGAGAASPPGDGAEEEPAAAGPEAAPDGEEESSDSLPPLDVEGSWREAGKAVVAGSVGSGAASFTAKERAIVSALAHVLIPPDSRLEGIDPAPLFERYALGLPANYLFALRAAMRFVEYSPLVFQVGLKISIRRFSALSPEDRERVLRRLDESRNHYVRTLLRILRSVLHLTYYSQADVSRRLGFDPVALRRAAHGDALVQGTDGLEPGGAEETP